MRPEREVVVLFARESCEVEDNNEVNLTLVRPAVLKESLQLRTVGRLCAFAFFPEPLENFVPLSLRQYSSHARSCVGRLRFSVCSFVLTRT